MLIAERQDPKELTKREKERGREEEEEGREKDGGMEGKACGKRG